MPTYKDKLQALKQKYGLPTDAPASSPVPKGVDAIKAKYGLDKMLAPSVDVERPLTDPSKVTSVPVGSQPIGDTGVFAKVGATIGAPLPDKRDTNNTSPRTGGIQMPTTPRISDVKAPLQAKFDAGVEALLTPAERERKELQQQKAEQRRQERLTAIKGNPDYLFAALVEGRILPADMQDVPADKIPWQRMAQIPNTAWYELGKAGQENPEAARTALLDYLSNRETTGYDVTRAIRTAASDTVTMGAQPIDVPPQTPAGEAAFFGTKVATEIPLVYAAGATGGRAATALARGAGVTNPLALSAAQAAGTGATLATAKEGVKAVADMENFDPKEAAKNILSTTGTYAAFGPVYEGLGQVGSAAAKRLPVGLRNALEKAGETVTGKVVGGTVQGGIAGGIVGAGEGAIEALQTPEGRNAKTFVETVLRNIKEEGAEEFVEAIALGIVRKWLPMDANAVVETVREMKAQTSQEAPSTPETQPADATPQVQEQASATVAPQAEAQPVVEEAPQTGKRPSKQTRRSEAIRQANPGMDEKAILDVVRQTNALTDEEFAPFAERMGKPEAPAPTETPTPRGAVKSATYYPNQKVRNKDASPLVKAVDAHTKANGGDQQGFVVMRAVMDDGTTRPVINSTQAGAKPAEGWRRLDKVSDTYAGEFYVLDEGAPTPQTTAEKPVSVPPVASGNASDESYNPGDKVFWLNAKTGERRTGTIARVNTKTGFAFIDVDGAKPDPANRAQVSFGDLGRVAESVSQPATPSQERAQEGVIPEGFVRQENTGRKSFTVKVAEQLASDLRSDGREVIVTPDPVNPKLRQVYASPLDVSLAAQPPSKEGTTKDNLRSKVRAVEGEGVVDTRMGIVSPGTQGQTRRGSPTVDVPAPPDIEERWQDASKPLPQESSWQKAKEMAARIWEQKGRVFPDLPNGKRFANLKQKLLRLKKGRGIASDQSALYLQGITVELNKQEYDLFRRAIVLADMMEDVELAGDSIAPDFELAYGYTPDSLAKHYAEVSAAVESLPTVQRALTDRKASLDEVVKRYWEQYEKLHGKPPPFTRQNYFRHEVLKYMGAEIERLRGTGESVKDPKGRGFLKKRKMNPNDFNNRYLEVEFRVFSEMLYDANVMEVLNFVNASENIADKVKEAAKKVAKETGRKVNWETLIPDGYTTWQPDKGKLFYKAWSISEQYVEQAMEQSLSEVNVPIEKVRAVWAMGGDKAKWVIPNEVARTLDNFSRAVERMDLDDVVKKGMRMWKQHQLLFPTRAFKYNARNMSGDADATITGNPAAFKRVPQAFNELWTFLFRGSAPTAELEAWMNQGGMQDVLQVAENIQAVNGLKQFRNLADNPRIVEQLQNGDIPAAVANIFRKVYSEPIRKGTDFREFLLRYANFLEYRAQLLANEGKPKNYGASIPEEVDAIDDIDLKAYKLSNDLLGAYDEVSQTGQWLSDHIYPFWRWNEVNFKRYVQLMRNAMRDGEGTQTMGRLVGGKLAKTVVKSPVYAYRVGKFMLAAHALSGALAAWNHLLFPEEEDELPENVKARPHIILGIPGVPGSARDEEGNVRYFNRLGSVSDFWEWFGLNESPQYVEGYLNGKMTLKEIAADMVKSPTNKLWQGLGPARTAFEFATGRTTYPDVTSPRNIRDRWEFLADSLAIGDVYRWAVGKPQRNAAGTITEKAFYYKVDPGEAAYNDALAIKYRWMEKEKGTKVQGAYDGRSNALYYLKQAIRYGDKEAMEKYMLQYVSFGGTKDGLKQSLESMNPYHFVSKQDRTEFEKSLTETERELFERAERWYEEVLVAGDPRGIKGYDELPKRNK